MKSVLFALFVSLPVLCQAELLEVLDGGFAVRHTVDTAASPAGSWALMAGHIDEWWNPEHSCSGSAGNLYVRAEVGGWKNAESRSDRLGPVNTT